jgi:hypothetical protein
MSWKESKIKTFFIEILSFSTPKARVINLSSIFLLLTVIPTKYLIYSPVKCAFKNFLLPLFFHGHCPISGLFANCNCPACGMTRGMSRLLHGDFSGAWNFNKLVFIVFTIMMFILIKDSITLFMEHRKNHKKRKTTLEFLIEILYN